MPPSPRITPTNNASVAQSAAGRLTGIIPNLASENSPNTVWLAGTTVELAAVASPPSNTLGNPGSGAWTCPAGVIQVQVECWGGGGGGGGGGLTASGGGGGGGGGEYACELNYPVIPGQNYSYTCGNGGNGGLTGQPGTQGTATSFDLQGIGLPGGVVANGGMGGDPVIGAGGAGGTGSANSIANPGGLGGTNAGGVGNDNPVLQGVTGIKFWCKLDDAASTHFSFPTVRDFSSNNLACSVQATGDDDNVYVQDVTSPSAPAQVPTANGAKEVAEACGLFSYPAPNDLNDVAYVSVANPTWSSGGFTFSCWVQAVNGGFNGLSGKGGCIIRGGADADGISTTSSGFNVYITRALTLNLLVSRPNGSGGFNTATATMPAGNLDATGNWNYIVCTYDGTTMNIYLYNPGNTGGVHTTATGPSGSGSAVQVGANSVFLGAALSSGIYTNGLGAYASNFWAASSVVTSTFVGNIYNSTSAPTGGAGGGASGSGGGAGGTGSSGVSSSGGAGGLPASITQAGSTQSAGETGGAGGAANANGNTGVIALNGFGAGGGGAGASTGSLPGISTLILTAAQSASYSGPDAVTSPSTVYTFSLDPQPGDKPLTSAASLSPAIYQGAQFRVDGNYQGTMSSMVLLPNNIATSVLLTTKTISNMYLSAEVLSPNAATLILGYATDTTLPTTFTSSTVVNIAYLGVPPSSNGTVVTWDLSNTGLGTALQSGNAGCLVIGPGNAPGAADYTGNTAAQYSVALIGAGGVQAGYLQDLTLTVTYSATTGKAGGDGAPGKILITFINPQGTPVASLQPAAITDGSGNTYAGGYNGNSVAFQPGSNPATPEVQHTVGGASGLGTTLATGWSVASAPFPLRFKLMPDNTVLVTGRLVNSSNLSSGPISITTLPTAYAPATEQTFIATVNNNASPYAASGVYCQIDTTGLITMWGTLSTTQTLNVNFKYSLD